MKLPRKTLEKKLFKSGYRYICAVDEVGMGCLAGPVVVCAMLFTPDFYKNYHHSLIGLRDSKLLTAHQREAFAHALLKKSYVWHQLAYCYPKTIDRLNIYQAARQAMRRAVKKLKPKNYNLKTIVLVDGKTKIKSLRMEQIPIVKGDRKIFAIACASILAKVYRDRMMERYAKRHPEYGFERHKGYGTKMHREKIAKFGLSPLHRRSFRH